MSEHLRHSTTLRGLIAWTLLLILAVKVQRAARHPLRYARYLTARAFRRIPGRDPDGDPLDRDEAIAFIGICRGWKHATPERTPRP